MTQLQLDQAVARTTGESLATIGRLGFQLQPEPAVNLEPEDLHLAVACSFCGSSCVLPAGPVDPNLLAECDRCDIYFDFDVHDIHVAGSPPMTSGSTRTVDEVAA